SGRCWPSRRVKNSGSFAFTRAAQTRLAASRLFRSDMVWPWCCAGHSCDLESFVPAGLHLVADAVVVAGTADVGQQPARLALNVGARIPGGGAHHQGSGRHLVVMPDPLFFPGSSGFDRLMAVITQPGDAVGHPIDLILETGGHVAERGGGRERPRHGEQIGKAVDLEP